MGVLSSRDNPRVRRWMKLASDPRLRRKEGRVLIEGAHLLASALARGIRPVALLVTEKALSSRETARLVAESGIPPVILSDAVLRAIADAETPSGIAAELPLPPGGRAPRGTVVFLEGIQDPGNVGAILRSAAAFGVASVLLDRGCADPWSPRVLRAGMGGHFQLDIAIAPSLAGEVGRFSGRIIGTVPDGGTPLGDADLSGRLGWVFGSEGKGISADLRAETDLLVRIPTAPGTESLNVAAAAAICLYERFSRPDAGS